MKKLLPFTVILCFYLDGFSQNTCGKVTFTSEQNERRDADSAFALYHQGQINYYVDLRKNIIPKYWKLKEEVLKQIDPTDIKSLLYLNEVYIGEVESYLNEMRATNSRVINNLRPSSEITNVLMCETFRAYPDTWALLINPEVINRNNNAVDQVIINDLYKKYAIKFENLDECINAFSAERRDSMKKHKSGVSFQGEKDEYNANRCDLADILLWAIQ